ncbi:copper chaperone for superoxide dismutase-like isoform X2 [Lineus longissimus]|uniref:copper chaperone for superoxide dismutase-like isoform X2 n=1 Tax=Lineus longissimus TaxID=88925 RepID=UPI00315CCB88
MAAPMAKIEYNVQMTCQSCVTAIRNSLEGQDGIQSFSIDLPTETVVVETSLPSQVIQDIMETTGRRAVLKGMGNTLGQSLGAAVSIMDRKDTPVTGMTRIVQLNEDTCLFEGTIDGLLPGEHGVFVHELGDMSEGCESCGDVLQDSNGQVIGNLGMVTTGKDGRATFRWENKNVKVWEMIGRSLVIHSKDDKRLMKNTDNFGKKEDCRVACGIIARSSGLFQNPKKICLCDGVTLWDERDVPLVGPERQKKAMANL